MEGGALVEAAASTFRKQVAGVGAVCLQTASNATECYPVGQSQCVCFTQTAAQTVLHSSVDASSWLTFVLLLSLNLLLFVIFTACATVSLQSQRIRGNAGVGADTLREQLLGVDAPARDKLDRDRKYR